MGIETLAMVALASSVGSGVIGAVGASDSADASADAANYRAQVATNNATLANRQATYDTQVGDIQSMQSGRQTRARMGSVRATEGANGIDVNSGSAVDLQRDVAQQGALDGLTIRNNAARKAYTDQINSQSYTGEASLDRSQASDAETAGFVNSFGSILGSASKVADKWSSLKTAGAL